MAHLIRRITLIYNEPVHLFLLLALLTLENIPAGGELAELSVREVTQQCFVLTLLRGSGELFSTVFKS